MTIPGKTVPLVETISGPEPDQNACLDFCAKKTGRAILEIAWVDEKESSDRVQKRVDNLRAGAAECFWNGGVIAAWKPICRAMDKAVQIPEDSTGTLLGVLIPGQAVAHEIFTSVGGRWIQYAPPLTKALACGDPDPKGDRAYQVTLDGRITGTLRIRRTADPYGRFMDYSTPLWGVASSMRLMTGRIPRVPFTAGAAPANVKEQPVVLTTSARFQDPLLWRPLKQREALLPLLAERYSKDLSVMIKTDDEDEPPKRWLDVPSRMFRVERAYRNNRGETIASARLDVETVSKEGFWLAEPAAGQWFFISADGRTARHFGGGLSLVDAGDYDADGKTEYMFTRSDDQRPEELAFLILGEDFAVQAEKTVWIERRHPIPTF